MPPPDPSQIIPVDCFMDELFQPFAPRPIPVVDPWRRLLRLTLTPTPTGEIPFQNIVLSMCKKAAKSSYAAAIGCWWALFIAPDGKDICSVANKREQAKGRAFRTMKAAFEAHPLLRSSAKFIGENLIETTRGVRIYPVTSDGSGEAGVEPSLVIADELWGQVDDRSEELWTELTPVPTLHGRSCRLITSYAGWKSKSRILWRVYEAWKAGEPVEGFEDWINDDGEPIVRHNRRAGLIGCWDDQHRMPWQQGPEAERYYEQERALKSRSEYERVHHNRWAEAQEGIDMEEYDSCVDKNYVVPTPSKSIYLAAGVDASVTRDYTAVATLYLKDGRYCLGPWKLWMPEKGVDFDIEKKVGEFIRTLEDGYSLRDVYYDEYQMHQVGLRLREDGIRAQSWKQTIPNVTLMGNLLTETLRNRQFRFTANKTLREQFEHVSLVPSPNGVMIKKERNNLKIDLVVALAMARVAASNLPESGDSSGSIIEVLG